MRTGIIKTCGLAAFVTLLPFLGRAENNCIDSSTTNSLTCQQPGTLSAGYNLTPTNINAAVSQTIIPPTVSGLSITNGRQIGLITDYINCVTNTRYLTNGITYTFGSLYFEPAIPTVLWTPGVYSYTAKIIATGSPCSPITNTLGVVTITIASNTQDVLLDVDFGGTNHVTKTGYAAIGDSSSDIWNYYSKTNITGSLSNLVTAEGLVSPVGLLVTNLPTAGTNGSSDAMYNGYLGTNAATATLTFTNLPGGSWNVYLYARDGNFTLSVGTNNYGTQACADQPLSSVLWQQGVQYVVFTNVVVSTGQPLKITVNPGTNGVAMISGLQIASTTHAAPPSQSAGLLAYYPFNGNANDESGNGFNAQVNGAVLALDRFSQSSRAYFFNGASAYMTNSDPTGALNFDARSNTFTISLWVNLTNLSQRSEFIIDRVNQNQHCSYEMFYYPDLGRFIIANWDGVNSIYVESETIPVTNTWYHVALVCDTHTYKLYVNGVREKGPQWNPDTSNEAIPSDFGSTRNTEPGRTIGRFAGPFNGFYTLGRLDDIRIYNRAFSSNEVYSLYDYTRVGDGLGAGDADYDGVTDYQELADRTDPNNPNSVLPKLLGYWPFDNTNTWVGNAGQLPLLATNVAGVPSWNTNAVLIDSNTNAVLKYRDVETNGYANINLRNGTIRFWFKPNWTSADQDGTGPQDEGRLIEVGTKGSTNGWWSLLVNSNGTNIYFCTQTNSNGTLTTNLTASISWVSDIWHQVVLIYNSTNISLYIDGQTVTNGSGIAYYPSLAVRAQGFRIGGDADGNNQVRGVFDELATFNYQLDAGWIGTDYTNYLNLLPSIVVQPVNQTTVQGSNATFSVAATGMGPLSYQWQFNGNDIPGATGTSYTRNNIQPSDTGSYSAVVTNSIGSINSADANLIVVGMSRITVDGSNPENQGPIFACSGAPITLRAIPDPSSVSLPSGFPVWTVMSQPSGSSIADPVVGSPTAAITPVVLGQYVIQAACGTSLTTCTINCVGQSDSDYDGVSDCEEVSDGTDPTDPTSVLPVRLAYWNFDNTNNWIGAQGQLPLSAAYTTGVSSWNTNAVEISAANAVLAYRDVEANAGHANINLRTGTIRFWFRPDWSSTDAGGAGPQAEARLIEIGSKGATSGWWGLVIDMSGTNFYFGTQTNSTLTLTTNLKATISWSSNTWHQIALTYSTNNSLLYLDGKPVATNGLAVAYYPDAGFRAQGFTIGGSVSGANLAKGAFDELETFNYMLDTASIQLNYQTAIGLDSDGDGWPDIIENMFGTDPNNPNSIPQGITIDHPSDGSVISR